MKSFLFVAAMLLGTAGFAHQIQSAHLTASGLTCSMCSKAIYKALVKLPTIEKVDVDIDNSAYIINFKPGADISPDDLRKAVEGAGFAVAGLQMTVSIPGTVAVKNDASVTVQGATYRLLRAEGKVLQGTQTFKVIDKAYLSVAEWKKFAKVVPAKREQGVFYVTL